MKRQTALWVRKAEEDIDSARALVRLAPPHRNSACFHCQQVAEKYLKALLQEHGAGVPRIYDLEDLLDLLLTYDPTLAPLRRSVAGLTKYAVEYRYPGMSANTRQMTSALRIAERIRGEIRVRLRLVP